MKRVVIISDLHCGHLAGLTPEDWEKKPESGYGTKAYEQYRHRREAWKFYEDWCAKLQPVHALICNGDALDGKGPRSGSTELITVDRTEQCDMATACIQEVKAKHVVMSYGTPYHTGINEDWEDQVARQVEAEKIGGHDWIAVNGVVFDYKHHVGRSSIPHGRFTAIARDRLWNLLWAERGEYPKANILIRSHVHYHVAAMENDYAAVITPALQGYGSKYGVRRMSDTVDFGLIWFDIEEDGTWTMGRAIKRFTRGRNAALVL